MKFMLGVVTITILTLVSQSGSMAQQSQGGACATPGTAVLANVPATRAQILPSMGRQIAGYGRQAIVGNCLITLVCVGTDKSDQARDVARGQCVAVRDYLVRSGFPKANIDTSRKNPGNGRAPGMVYFSLQ